MAGIDSQIRGAYEAAVKNHTLDLRHYWRVAARHKWRVLFMMGVGAVIGLVLALALPRYYEASTTLVIERPRLEASPVEAAYRFDVQTNEYFLTQFEILKSDDLAFAVYQDLGVAQHPSFQEDLASPTRAMKSFVRGLIPWGQSGDEVGARQHFEHFKEALSITPLTNTQAVRISFRSRDPEFSAAVANGLAQQYLRTGSEVLAKMAGEEGVALQSEAQAARERLQQSEQALQAFREREGLVDVASGEGLAERELGRALEQLQVAEQRYAEIKAVYEQVEHLVGGASAAAYLDSPLLAGDAQLQAAQTNYETARREYESLASMFVEGHPDIAAAQVRLGIARDALVEQARTRVLAIRDQYQQAERVVADARARLDAVKADLQNLNRNQFQLVELERQVEANRAQYEALMAQASALGAMQNLAPSSARVVDTAWPPLVPTGPGTIAMMLLMSLLSGLLTLLWILGRDAFDDTLKTPTDVRQRLGLPLLGYVPKTLGNEEAPFPQSVIAEPYSFGADAVYRLSAAVQQAAGKASDSVLVVTSPLPGEGTTTVALNLALAQAEVCRTLLIEGGFLQPQLSRLLAGASIDCGLVEVLEDGMPLERALFAVPDSSLDLLPLSHRPDNPQKLMALPQLQQLMEELRRRYDRIIIDCGPVHAVSDAILWGSKADGVIVVTEAGGTDASLVESAIDKLAACGKPVMGVVLNQAGPEHSPDFADYFSNYYSKAEEEAAAGRKLLPVDATDAEQERKPPVLAPVRALRPASDD